MRPATPIPTARRSPRLALALLAVCLPTRAAEWAPPTPPRQAEPWTPPPTSLPRFLVSSAATLFAQGLADPRGCEYRTIRITVGNVWGWGTKEVETRGWVLPEACGGKPRHAIAWSGLVYPLAGVGAPADLAADVTALIELAIGPKDRPVRKVGFHLSARLSNNEEASISTATLLPIKVCLLLRLNWADLAESVWDIGIGRPAPPKPAGPARELDLTSYGFSYLTLANDLAWYHFDRAVCAHMRGDDPLALADARFLDGFARAVDGKADAMGFDLPRRDRPGPTSYIAFLDQLPALLADQERRARERAEPPAPPRGEGQAARVADLIRQLDEVAVRQWGQPGGVVLGESPIIEGLIAEGDAAVEPLIRDFRSDDRLTRSVGFGRDFVRGRRILGADQAAFTALTGILRTSTFAPPSPDGTVGGLRTRQAVADEIQAYWEKYRAVPLAERWYRTLADDRAGADAWLEAAGNITQPVNVRTIPGGAPFVVTQTTSVKPGERPPLRGDVLREGHEPTVAALMARRVESMLKTPEGQRFELRDPCRMAALLADWDPRAGLPTLREMTRICRARHARPGIGHDWTTRNLAVSIARFILARDGAGDAGALREYAEWIRTVTPDAFDHDILAVLEPLHRKPDDPALAAAADWLFGDPRSPWVPRIGRKGSRSSSPVAELIASPMTKVPAFRKMLRAALDDRAPIGEAEVGDNGLVNVKLDTGLSMGRSEPKGLPDAPARGTKVSLRVRDFYAWQLATLEGAPAFHPCWPESRRDTALAAMADFLAHQGSR